MPEFSPFYQGLGIGLGLIVVIGAQNAFVIKQGFLKNQTFIIALTCALINAVLIVIGVTGLSVVISSNKTLLTITKYWGIVFLIYYGAIALSNAFKNDILYVSNDNTNLSLKKAFLTIFAVSILNPHLYLDTCILIGVIGSQFVVGDRFYFAYGAILGSFIWFFFIGYGARWLLPTLQNTISWKILNFIIGVVMFSVGISLVGI